MQSEDKFKWNFLGEKKSEQIYLDLYLGGVINFVLFMIDVATLQTAIEHEF